MDQLTDRELGVLASSAWRPHVDSAKLWKVFKLFRERSPVFDAESAVAALNALSESAKSERYPGQTSVVDWMLEAAAKVVTGCLEFHQAAVIESLQCLVDLGIDTDRRYLEVALLSCAGREVPEHPDELIRDDFIFLCSLEHPQDRIEMAQACSMWSTDANNEVVDNRGSDPLALISGYLEHAEKLTAKALNRAQAIQSGVVDYKADKAFTVSEAQAIRYALRAGLDQRAKWALDASIPLLNAVSLAPKEKVKTMPSQSAAIAVSKAIAARPTPSLVSGMKAVVAEVRHAGIKKKMGRFLKTAERRLFEDDDFLFELEPNVKITKTLSVAVVRALEACCLRSTPIDMNLWFSRFLENKAVSGPSSALIWRLDNGKAVLPVNNGDSWTFIDHKGQVCESKTESISLWHPIQQGAKSDEWRAFILQRGIQQPFNQIFRETYSAQSIPQFLLPELDMRTLLGLAKSQGWVLRNCCLIRRLGPLRVELNVGDLYPGASGSTRCFAINFYRGAESESLEPSAEDPQIISECMRAIDLLISVSAFSLDPDEAVESASALERRAVLTRMLGSSPQTSDKPYVEGRYVRVGENMISISTGRSSRNGEEIVIPATIKRAIFLPYPDEVLQRIVIALNQLKGK
jgi:hypothetical protein